MTELNIETELQKQEVVTNSHWQRNPIDWIKDTFGNNITLSSQQENGFIELGKLITAKIKAHKKQKLNKEEKEYASKIGLSIMAGQGVGKDTFGALTTLFFLYCFSHPRILCTAPTNHQLKDVLWAEISKWMRKSKKADPNNPDSLTILQSLFEWQAEKVFLKEKGGKEWFAVARSANVKASPEEQAETLSGLHEDFMLYVIDEASGLPDPVFKPIEGSLTGIVNIVVMIFNPTKTKGVPWESQYGKDKRWVKLRWNAEESELVSQEQVVAMAEKYGKDSNTYRIRVLGIPPTSEADTLIPWDWIDEAVERDIEPLFDDMTIKGLDIGGGGDDSIMCTRKGGKVYPFKRNSSSDSNTVSGWALNDFDADGTDKLFGDGNGLGHGIMGNLLQERGGFRIINVKGQENARNEELYFNKRTEMLCNLRKAFETKNISIPNDQNLIDQLGALKTDTVDNKGRIKIERKAELTKVLGYSSNEVDSLALTYSNPGLITKKNPETLYTHKNRIQQYDEHAWMGM